MSKIEKMRACDWMLIAMLALMLASSIQLEATDGRSPTWVWVHIAVGIIFLLGIGWHLFEHFKWKNWIKRISQQKSIVTRWLGVFYVLTILSAIAVLIYWLRFHSHSSLGGWHGKIGFIFLAICIGHTIKRRKSPVLLNKR